MNILRTLLLAVALTAIPGGATWADTTAEPTIEKFFTVSPGDRSSAFMAEIFGPAGWQAATFTNDVQRVDNRVIPGEGGILGLISSVLNLACMLLAVLIMTWGAVAANLQGAVEGADAGRRYSLLWVPLRSIGAFGMLLPTIGGYSLIQMIVMWLIHLSIGIGNSAYSLVLDNFYAGKPSVPIYVDDAKQTATDVFYMELCQRALVDENGVSLIERKATADQRDVNWGNQAKSVISSVVFVGLDGELFDGGTTVLSSSASYTPRGRGTGWPTGVCGSEQVKQNSNSFWGNGEVAAAANQLYTARLTALSQLHTDMGAVAQRVMDMATQTGGAAPSAVSPSNPSAGDWGPLQPVYEQYHAAYVRYRQSLTDAASDATQALLVSGRGPDNKYMDIPESLLKRELQAGGWIMMGAVYWNMQALNRTISNVVNDSGGITTVPPDLALIDRKGVLNPQVWVDATSMAYRLGEMALADLNRRDSEGALRSYVSTLGTASTPKHFLHASWDAIVDWGKLDTLTNKLTDWITSDGDFLWGLMSVGEVSWNLGFSSLALGMAGSGFDKLQDAAGAAPGVGDVEGKGAPKRLPRNIGATIAGMVGGLLIALAVPMIVIGFFLAFYLPSVPLLLWTINIVGWMIQSVKAVIVAPVWAAAHAIPEGDGFAGQNARSGYFLMIGIVLRPVLLIAGILLGALLLQVVGWFVRFILPIMFSSLDVNSPPSFFAALATFLIVVGLLVALTLKCFSLSHEVADEVLEWIGGRQVGVGDSSVNDRVGSLIAAVGAREIISGSSRGVQGALRSTRNAEAQAKLGGGGGAGGPGRDSHLPT